MVSLVGYLFHRYEHEQAANLAELRRLVEGLGAHLGPTFLAGGSVDTLQRAHAALDRREAEVEKLKTPDQLAEYQQRMKQYFLDQLGPMPERTPLKPQVVGKLQYDGYRIEKAGASGSN